MATSGHNGEKKRECTLSACLDMALRKTTSTYGVDHHAPQRQTEHTHYLTKPQTACRGELSDRAAALRCAENAKEKSFSPLYCLDTYQQFDVDIKTRASVFGKNLM